MNLHTVIQSAFTNLQSYQQCMSVLFSSQFCQYLLFLVFFFFFFYNSHWTDVRWYLIVLLIYIFLMVSDGEHLCMCLLAICMSSLEKCLLSFCAHFFFFLLFIFYWRIITLQNFPVFCQTSTWINHRYTYIPPFWTSLPSPSPPHPSRLIQSPY